MKIVARTMTVVLVAAEVESTPKIPRNPATISLTQARASRATIVPAPPTIMNGFLLPHDTRQLSLQIPIYGCTRAPVNGPAIHTKASRALLIPRDSKYGYNHRQSVSKLPSNPRSRYAYRSIRQLNGPYNLKSDRAVNRQTYEQQGE